MLAGIFFQMGKNPLHSPSFRWLFCTYSNYFEQLLCYATRSSPLNFFSAFSFRSHSQEEVRRLHQEHPRTISHG